LIAGAWMVPLLWLAVAWSLGPSDGTVVSSSTAVLGDARWGTSVTVVDTIGSTPLRPGDRIEAIEQDSPAGWLSGSTEIDAQPGDTLDYRVRRSAAGLDRIQQVEVRLTRYPVGPAVAANLDRVVLVSGLLLAGSVLVWRTGREPLSSATLVAGSTAGVGLSAPPFGPHAVDLVTPRGLLPYGVGETGLALTLGAVLLLAVSFPTPPMPLARRPALAWLLLLAPLLGYAVWVATFAAPLPDVARTQAALDVSLPAAAVTVMLAVPALAAGYRRAVDPQARVSVRLLVVSVLAATLVATVLHGVPVLFRGEPLVPWDVLGLVLVPFVLACWVAAVQGYRLLEVDALLRRSLLQLVLASMVGALFLLGVGAVSTASGGSLPSMVTGGVVALVLLPAAVLMRRTISRLAYGERADPDRLVSRLRRLSPGTGPEEALRETLELLSRSFKLSYAAVEGTGESEDERFHIALGELRGEPTSVALEVAGRPVGRLDMEVSLLRDPFGPRDHRLLEDLGLQVGALLQAQVANRQLRRAREHLVTAREEERRRLQRDLHDGLGPSLASTLMRLEAARDLIPSDPSAASDLVDRLADQTEATIADIRRLVDGLRPPVLDQLGLASALRNRADEHNLTASLHHSLTWSVDADELGRLPAAVEVAAFRIVEEAVTNAIRHSRGRTCRVVLRRTQDALRVEVLDDGVGPDGTQRGGVGVASMRERAEELGGGVAVRPGPAGGTLVEVTLPLVASGSDREA
jgi:two-component system, NarL family, sensor kinase